ncbi:bolA-like protein 3 isoform X1 [Harpegnathos saltator]|uniref:bolA-like protein 3 isoform X1 n=1 Tax=Harpegnathos saltator TaxID=610380 RepID=UPI00058C265D|nr:bolA-like protein 3 isoform X1 [Harpegnathos saltator]XP_025158437.1 bolA-like protein 3 isoform X1 [Harpegnathos saltator]
MVAGCILSIFSRQKKYLLTTSLSSRRKNKRPINKQTTTAIHSAMFQRAFKSSFRGISLLSRLWNGPGGVLAGKQAEQKMISILRNKLPEAVLIEVTDVSGGCGAMFDINVVAPEFKGLNTVKQHRIINEALKEEIKDMHGIRIRTSLPQP